MLILLWVCLLFVACSETMTPEQEKVINELKEELSSLERENFNCLDSNWLVTFYRLSKIDSNCSKNIQALITSANTATDNQQKKHYESYAQRRVAQLIAEPIDNTLWLRELGLAEASRAALTYAALAEASYTDLSQVVTPSGVWEKKSSWEDLLEEGLLYNSDWNPNQIQKIKKRLKRANFYACVYTRNGQYVLAFRGTDTWVKEHISANLPQLLFAANNSTQYQYAPLLAGVIQSAFGDKNLVLVGHSLGGGLAQYASTKIEGGLKVITFNSAGLGSYTSDIPTSKKIVNFRTEGDIVSTIGDQKGRFQYTVPAVVKPGSFSQSTPSISESTPLSSHKMGHVIRALTEASTQKQNVKVEWGL